MNGYFDHNATTPLHSAAREAWVEAYDRHWHNPSSLYREAGAAKIALEDAREELADALGIDTPERVIFTGGATEANNALIDWAADHFPDRFMAHSAIEHPSVRDAAQAHFGKMRVISLPIATATGVLELETVRAEAGRGFTSLISVMAANNETGTLQPWREAAALCRSEGVLFHCDAAQWIGKLDPGHLGECDFVTGSAHKFGGPKGVGFLTIPEESEFRSSVGGPQENGHRAGTENLPGILAMMAALREANPDLPAEPRDQFETALVEKIPGTKLIGTTADRLANTSMFVLPGDQSNLKWLTRLSDRGYSVSTGSACSAGKSNPSHVMEAMELTHEEMGRVLRVSAAEGSNWTGLLDALIEVAAELHPIPINSKNG